MRKLLVAAFPLLLLAVAAVGCGTSKSPVLVSSAGFTASNVTHGRAVDLDEPGALETLQYSNPAHYEKIRKILEGILLQRDEYVARWIYTDFDGHDVTYVPIVLTSNPPKRRLSFVLDATRYKVAVALTNVLGEIVPAR